MTGIARTGELARIVAEATAALREAGPPTEPPLVQRARPVDQPLTAADREILRDPEPAKALAHHQVAQWGVERMLIAQGGQAAVDDFWSNLISYLKTTRIGNSPSDVV
ncbi:MAG: hypothetical protein ACK41C_11080 [Phenylobacterium sp.]|uniref:hypothetical protein n=1 Tax=Phenylobacterium sp. TaxID=1871053 RepID=UPI00391A742F